MDGKQILITGASGGIGLEVTRTALEEGAKVTAHYHTNLQNLEEMVKEYPDSLTPISADIREEDAVSKMFRQAEQRFGRVDITVANAGIANHEGVGIHEMPVEQWNNTMAVNLRGVFLCAKHFFQNLERHPARHGSLILVGSTAGLFGEAWYCDYSSSKAALHGLMMSLKNEIPHLAELGRVNLVNPGWTHTPMAEEALSDSDMVGRIIQTIPMRKVAKPKDIANAIIFLASDILAGHISGQTITVAGGMEGRVLFSDDEVGPFLP